MFEQLFTELGFSDKEVKLYLLLAQSGKSTAQLLAKRAKMPRTTVYSVLAGLVEKGLASEERASGTTFFIVNKPTAILRGVETQAADVKKKELLARELIERITPLFKAKLFGLPKVQFFEGRPGVQNLLYDHCRQWRESLLEADGVWVGIQHSSLSEQYWEWEKHYAAHRSSAERTRLFTNQAPSAAAGVELRRVPAEFDYAATIWVMGEFVVLLMTNQEPHYAFELREPSLAKTLRVVFTLLWQHTGKDSP